MLTTGPVAVTATATDNCAGVDATAPPHLWSRLNDGGKNASAHNEWIVDLVSNGNPAVTNSTLGWELAGPPDRASLSLA